MLRGCGLTEGGLLRVCVWEGEFKVQHIVRRGVHSITHIILKDRYSVVLYVGTVLYCSQGQIQCSSIRGHSIILFSRTDTV